MNNTMKRVMAVCVLCTMAVSAFGCSGKNNNSEADMPVETISLEQTKQDLTWVYGKNSGPKTDATEGTEDTEDTDAAADTTKAAETTKAGETTAQQFEEVTQAMNVTDADGHGVTDAAGQSVTEWVVVETRPVQNPTAAAGQDPTQAPATAAATEAPASTYTPAYDTCKAYWVDMSQAGDYQFNGEFLTITFEVNQDIPDGSYPVTIAATDIASWDMIRYDPVRIDGEVAVGTEPKEQEALSQNDFCMKVNSVSAKQGEVVTVTVDLANNPGFCAFVIDFQYDSNALTIVETAGGKDYDNAVHLRT